VHINENDGTFARVPISTLTREMERSGDIAGQSRAAFYTDVAACLIGRASARCDTSKLDVREPELELEQAMDIMEEVDEIWITDGLNGRDLIAAVASTYHGLVTVRERVKAAKHRQPATVRGENSDGGADLRPARTLNDEGPRGGRQRNDVREDLTRAAVERKQANANSNDVRVARMARRQRLTQLCRGALAHAKSVGNKVRTPDRQQQPRSRCADDAKKWERGRALPSRKRRRRRRRRHRRRRKAKTKANPMTLAAADFDDGRANDADGRRAMVDSARPHASRQNGERR